MAKQKASKRDETTASHKPVAVACTRLLAEKSQALDHWFYESVQPFVDARCKLIEYYGNVQITVGPSGTKVFHTLPAEVQKLDDELAESIEWLRQRFNHPANPGLQGTTHLVRSTLDGVVGSLNQEDGK